MNLNPQARRLTHCREPDQSYILCGIPGCLYPLDVAIVVDTSGSVDSEHMLKIEFTKVSGRKILQCSALSQLNALRMIFWMCSCIACSL